MSGRAPGLQPPPGGDVNKGPALAAVTTVIFTASLLSLCLRMFARLYMIRSTAWDDYTAILATVSICMRLRHTFLHSQICDTDEYQAVAAVNYAFIIKEVTEGGGRHAFYLGPQRTAAVVKWSNVATYPFLFATCITKISIALMILRISKVRWLKFSMWALMAFSILVNGACVVTVSTLCGPSQGMWDNTVDAKCGSYVSGAVLSSIQGGKVHKQPTMSPIHRVLTSAAWSIMSDLICTTLPIVVVWKINISIRQKIALSLLVGLGLL